jgi:TP901 family phage tail tape measure protein
VAERTRSDGSEIGNAIKTIATRISKVGTMPSYSDEVSNEDLSNASASLHQIGIEVYEPNGEYRELDTILGELNEKWDSLTDAQQSNIAYNIAATRQTSKFKNILESWTEAMSLAEEATTAEGNALENQEKYEESYAGKVQQISTQMDSFWINFFNSDLVDNVLDFITDLVKGLNEIQDNFGSAAAAGTAFFSIFAVKSGTKFVKNLFDNFSLDDVLGQP